MRKVAIYARYSTDLQNERSVADQISHCEEYARKQGYVVVAHYSDSAKSGASMHGRDGLARLLCDAGSRKFDGILTEALDRLSRDLGDLANLNKKLEFLGISVEATSHGVASEIDIALRGLIGSMFLKDLAHKVRRGLSGVVADGRHAGGRAYGYRPSPGRPGELEIVEDEAEIVRRIYREYVAGCTPREIVERLNKEGIRPPRSRRHWNASTLNGSASRGYGILRNPIYGGTNVWNRTRMLKDPDTGKRVSRVNPVDEQKSSEVPHLRIVDEKLFAAARALNERKGRKHASHARRPKHILSGLMKCAHCGGGMSIKDRDHGRVRIHCSTAKESGACSSRTAVYLDDIEHRVVTGLVSELKSQEALNAFVEAYNAENRKMRADASSDVAPLKKRLATIEKELERTVELVVKGVIEENDATQILSKLKLQRKELERQAAVWQAPNVVQLNRPAATVYASVLAELPKVLAGEDSHTVPEATLVFRSLVDKVVIEPVAKEKPKLRLYGKLAKLVAAGDLAGGISGSGGGT